VAHGLVAWWGERFPQKRARCLPGAEFAREYASALADQRLDQWRHELRGLDLFVLDDLGQLGAKRTAQQELLHLLDALADREALAIVTARALPTHAAVLLPALRSRLSAGLTVSVALPGPLARRVILEHLATARGLSLSKRAIHGLADGLDASVPVLSAALAELDLHWRVEGHAIDDRRVRQYVAQRDHASMPSLRDIACLTAKYFGLTLVEMKSPKRRQPLVAGRAVAMYLARQLTAKSFAQIGAYFGGRDHTTVLHGCRRTERLIGRDRATRQAVAELKRLLHAS
jgi:chromosomal replication initiator protein